MRATTFFHPPRRCSRFHPNVSRPRTRHLSTESLQTTLYKQLTARSPNIILDYLSPTPSHLLNVTLADFLPESCYPQGFSKRHLEPPLSYTRPEEAGLLPQGHHIIYFSPQVPSSALLSDGTDPLQSPGQPFVRRMWAGGSLHFDTTPNNQLVVDGQPVYCTESISDVMVKGTHGDEKVFITIKREIGNQLALQDAAQWPIVEERNLVFMRKKLPGVAKEDTMKPPKILKRRLEMLYLSTPACCSQFYSHIPT